MEHLKIRGPVRRAVCWVLTTGCGVTGTRGVLLHPALAMGERESVLRDLSCPLFSLCCVIISKIGDMKALGGCLPILLVVVIHGLLS